MSLNSFPSELVDLILSSLSNTPEISQCALVCQAWLPSARRHLFAPPKHLKLDQCQIVELLNLFDSPHSTIPLISISKLHLYRNNMMMNRDINFRPVMGLSKPEGWRNDTATADFLAKGPVFHAVSSLFLENFDWDNMAPAALKSLRTNYAYIRELELKCVEISFNVEFRNLLEALTALESIVIRNNVPYVRNSGVSAQTPSSPTETADSEDCLVRLFHPNLSSLAFDHGVPSSVLKYFARTVAHTVSTIDISVGSRGNGDWKEYRSGFEELLGTAGTRLRVLKLRFAPPRAGDTVLNLVANSLALPHNPNLHEIELDAVTEPVLKSFIQGLRLSPKPFLYRLKLAIVEPSLVLKGLEKWEDTWNLVDETLSSMPLLRDPELLVDIGILVSGLAIGRRFPASKELYAQKILEGLLPRTIECWKLEVRFGIKPSTQRKRMMYGFYNG